MAEEVLPILGYAPRIANIVFYGCHIAVQLLRGSCGQGGPYLGAHTGMPFLLSRFSDFAWVMPKMGVLRLLRLMASILGSTTVGTTFGIA